MKRNVPQADRLKGMQGITVELAKHLWHGETLYSVDRCNADGTAMRAKVTSVKTWKRDVTRIAIGYKHGLYDCGKLDYGDIPYFMVDQHTYDQLVRRSEGWVSWSYQHTTSGTSFTWMHGWYHPTRHVTKYQRCRAYGAPAEYCATCGTSRADQVDTYNSFPKLCSTCGAWY